MPTFPERLQQLDVNERALLTLLRYNGPATRQRLEEKTGLSSSSMHRLTGSLEQNGLISQMGADLSGGGRRPALYGIGKNAGLLVGVELSRTEVRILFCRPDLEPVEQIRFPLDAGYGPDETADKISCCMHEAMARQGVLPADIPGIGLGTVGSLDCARGIIRSSTGFLHEGWQDVPISGMLSERLDIPVHMDNGANLAVLAERLAGSGQGCGTLVCIHLGMGIRTGILSRGEILRFIGEQPDAFGHLSVDLNGTLCSCGNHGCMETFATLPAMAEILSKNTNAENRMDIQSVGDLLETIDRQDEQHQHDRLQGGTRIGTKTIAQGDIHTAHPDNTTGLEMAARLDRAAAAFGVGLVNLVRMTNTRLVILSGPLVRRSGRFYRTAVASAQRLLQTNPEKPVRFERDGHMGEWAIATGAAAYVLDLFLKKKDGAS